MIILIKWLSKPYTRTSPFKCWEFGNFKSYMVQISSLNANMPRPLWRPQASQLWLLQLLC